MSSKAKIEPVISSPNRLSPDQSSHSQSSRYGAWRWSARVRTLYRTTSATSRTSDATQTGVKRSGKLCGVNATNR